MYFEPAIPVEEKIIFSRYVHEHLLQKCKEVVRLRHVEGLRFREIAERLGRPLGTVLTQMRAALERMAAALEEYR